MRRRGREPGDVLFGVLLLAAAVLLGTGLFAFFIAHPIVSALWALGTTGGTVWFACLWSARIYQDRMRALTAERQRRAVPVLQTETVSSVLLSCRKGARIGDAERDVFVEALHSHFAAGRLDVGELSDRLAAALAARTIEDLRWTVDGLPSEVTGR
ncbi:DUF1707 domain-containing protein [Actinomadura sp. WMMA1423]|uniref:DUF1707 SHOCT-like domain-containing protein n=1 Tax=Actinomadura sp. WMMA1423 TaxID=2591108 RepID=UPI001F10E1C2|nr:DUF1707 domain-containing protein [Actinomadura sp. WMMA1423]